MELVTSNAQLAQVLADWRKQGLKVGFVPTMGYLHAGHLSLVRQAKAENDRVVVSIFVNPTQFSPNEDLAKYPRDLPRDTKLLEAVATDLLYYPSVEEVYPAGQKITVKADAQLSSRACGEARPGHFDGVVTVVARLFDLVQPQNAYFGLKDYQQYLVIKKMATDLKYPIQVISCPIVREADGLAMSSRNKYLSSTERQDALVLYRALQAAKQISTSAQIKASVHEKVSAIASAKLQYIEVLNRNTLTSVEQIVPGRDIILLAVYIGQTRLIDNLFL